jgi:cytochrome c oxidase subunit 3
MTPPLPALVESPLRSGGAGTVPPPVSGDDGDDGPFGSDGDGRAAGRPPATATIGVWLFIGAIVILFASFTSTIVVRRAEADWRLGPMPALLWLNTAALLASSAALEWARAGGRRGSLGRFRTGLAGAAVLGAAFLGGQWAAWQRLMAGGVSMASGPHSAFFYLLTGAHAVHVAGGVGALLYAWWRAQRAARPEGAEAVAAPVAIYWHFVDALWLYVFVTLFV